MADILKILMMGGQRSGKSSMLAGLLETMLNGKVKELVTVEDMTARSGTGLDLSRNIRDLKLRLLMTQDKSFLIDDENNKTNAFSDYLLEFAVPGTSSRMQMLFSDVNGEFYDKGQIHDTEISKLIRECDVFLVAIDTPFLMEAVNPSNRLCNESINLSYNHVRDLEDFFTELDDKDGADAKLVIFVPLKCEKWIREGQTARVVKRVEEVYGRIIHNLSAYTNVEIDIMPIQTVGNIVFDEQRRALVCNSGGKQRRCCISPDKQYVRFEDGTVERIDPQRGSGEPVRRQPHRTDRQSGDYRRQGTHCKNHAGDSQQRRRLNRSARGTACGRQGEPQRRQRILHTPVAQRRGGTHTVAQLLRGIQR